MSRCSDEFAAVARLWDVGGSPRHLSFDIARCRVQGWYSLANSSARPDSSGVGWISICTKSGTNMPDQVKPFTTLQQQEQRLRERGLRLDTDSAQQWLAHVGYYRLSGYWYPYRARSRDDPGRRLDEFHPGASLDEVTELYEFDRKLRTLVHDGMERVEVALRSHIGYVLGAHGSLSYQSCEHFRPTFRHADWNRTAQTRISRSRRHNTAIRHHLDRYDGIPIWVLMEILDFSDVSKLFDGMKSRDQLIVAENLGFIVDLQALSKNQRNKALKRHPLAQWLEQLTVIRNMCAHHSRLWNKTFIPVGTQAVRTMPLMDSIPEGQSERIYGALLVMGLILQTVSPGTQWSSKVRELIETSYECLKYRDTTEMGFPKSWKQEAVWMTPISVSPNLPSHSRTCRQFPRRGFALHWCSS